MRKLVFVFIIDFVSAIKSAIVLSLRFVIGVFMRYPINRTVPIVIHPKKIKNPQPKFCGNGILLFSIDRTANPPIKPPILFHAKEIPKYAPRFFLENV